MTAVIGILIHWSCLFHDLNERAFDMLHRQKQGVSAPLIVDSRNRAQNPDMENPTISRPSSVPADFPRVYGCLWLHFLREFRVLRVVECWRPISISPKSKFGTRDLFATILR